jgi:diketogulonate reductase-like aldo/keto reductase
MDEHACDRSRRRLLGALATAGAATLWPWRDAGAAAPAVRKAIPASGERLPVIGMGSWITFDVGDDADARAQRVRVLQAFFDHGGALVDSSPMYGSAQEVIGHALGRVSNARALFAATKVWTLGRGAGIRQVEDAERLWGVARFDLMQVHNLLDWETHLPTLKAMKAAGRLRHVGVTTSHGRRHDDLEALMRREPLDFVQLTYNLADREAEQRLLPLAAERGIAVIANRPFQGGALFRRVRGRPLPGWAAEIDCTNWAQAMLKFVVGHPAVTCAIPATSRVEHMIENMGAGFGRLPDAALRRRMLDDFARL